MLLDAMAQTACGGMIMKAIVCDKCGRVILLSDDEFFPDGINRLEMLSKRQSIDLCDECTEELMAAVLKED